MNPSTKQRIGNLFSLPVIMTVMILSPTILSCLSYVQVSHVVKGSQSIVYQINATGETTQSTAFNPGSLVRELNKGQATYGIIIKSFQLESMDVKVEPTAANTAQIFQLQSLLARQLNSGTLAGRELLNRQDKPIPVSKAGEFLVNVYLIDNGVEEINKLIGDAMVGRRPLDISTPILFDLKGQSFPANSRVSVKLTINLNVTIEYTQCEQVVDLFLEGYSEEC